MDKHRVCDVIEQLRNVLERNKEIAECKRRMEYCEQCIDQSMEKAVELAIGTYVKGLTRNKVKWALATEQGCLDLITELDDLLASSRSTRYSGSSYNRNRGYGRSRWDSLPTDEPFPLIGAAADAMDSLIARLSGPSSPEYVQGYYAPDWDEDE